MMVKLPLSHCHIIASHHLGVKVNQLIYIQLMSRGENGYWISEAPESLNQNRFFPTQ
jgi:hypothetical protein